MPAVAGDDCRGEDRAGGCFGFEENGREVLGMTLGRSLGQRRCSAADTGSEMTGQRLGAELPKPLGALLAHRMRHLRHARRRRARTARIRKHMEESEPGLRDQHEWTVEAKQELIARGYALADAELGEVGDDAISAAG